VSTLSTLVRSRRLIAVLCIAVLIAAAFTPATFGALSAILTPLWLLFAAELTISIHRLAENCGPRQLVLLPTLASRAPPIAWFPEVRMAALWRL